MRLRELLNDDPDYRDSIRKGQYFLAAEIASKTARDVNDDDIFLDLFSIIRGLAQDAERRGDHGVATDIRHEFLHSSEH